MSKAGIEWHRMQDTHKNDWMSHIGSNTRTCSFNSPFPSGSLLFISGRGLLQLCKKIALGGEDDISFFKMGEG